ncbi:MAG: hypothetical protein Q9222_001553 [Ikaeria aurantiellina]
MIQARSLSSVIELADNPPSLPNTSPDIQDPLVLYIARVPGSRDVFLTTSKPLQKVVTAQDVQSSLYYVHVDSEDDEALRNSSHEGPLTGYNIERTSKGGLSDIENRSPGALSHQEPGVIPRDRFPKPLGVDANNYILQAPVHDTFTKPIVKRKPVSPTRQPQTNGVSKHSSPNARVGGPRPMHAGLRSIEVNGLAGALDKENIAPRRWSEQPPTSSRHPSSKPPYLQDHQKLASYPTPELSLSNENSRPIYVTQESAPQIRPYNNRRSVTAEMRDLSLTVIRRYNGFQSNVASISKIHQGEGHPQADTFSTHDDILIHIATPGYSKFCSSNAENTSTEIRDVFERQFCRLRRGIRGSLPSEKEGAAQGNRRSRFSVDFRRSSQSYNGAELETISPDRQTHDSRSASFKDYGFYSPWNGTCEFTPSITGHALKCKHTPPTQGSPAVAVSELRFNLPSHGSVVSPSKILGSPARPNNTKRTSYFSQNHGSDSTHEKPSHQDRYDDEDKMHDFNRALGQEHAGGGFGGKQAKLGKLIVEAEGLKMLDLVVATNMGLWWKAYEKTA